MTTKNERIQKIIKGIFAFALFWFSSSIILIPAELLGIDIGSLNQKTRIILSTLCSLITALILFLIYKKDLKKEWKKYRNNFLENIDTGFKYWIIGLIVMIISNFIIIFIFKLDGSANEKGVQQMIQALPWLMIIEAGIIAPFNEEIVFRKIFKDNIKNKWIFILVSFIIFGSAHIIKDISNPLDYLYIIPYGSLGAVFALTYNETETVFTSMTFHMIHNTILVLLSMQI